ncbi:MAG TPA: helix-turn-helix domain-containing protein [Pyrinomonadaceae bacterium]
MGNEQLMIDEIQPSQETILSESEAAKYLKISRMTLFRIRERKEISFYRIGSRILYSIEKHLQPFLAKCEE